jgi:hypothetical protein
MKICIIILHLRAGERVDGLMQTLSESLAGGEKTTLYGMFLFFSDDLHF